MSKRLSIGLPTLSYRGEKMSDINLIISATDNASGPLGNINKSLNSVQNNANNTGGSFGGMGGKMKAALGVAGAAFAAFKGIAVINDKISDMDELAKRARAVGSASQEGFAQFQVASQFLAEGGLSAAEADRAFNNLQLRMAQGAAGSKAYAGIFEKLGDSVKDANGDLLEAPGLFEAVGQAVQDGTLSLDEASKVLGQRVGPKIVGMFEDLAAKGIDTKDALADVAANTNIVPLEAATQAEAFGDTIERMKQVLGKLMTDAIVPLMPILVDLAENVLAALPPIVEKVQKVFKALQPVFDLIGAVLTNIVFPIIGKIADGFILLLEAVGPLYEAALPALEKAMVVVSDIISTVVDKVMGFIDTLTGFKDKITEITGGVTEKMSGMADKVSTNMKSMSDGAINKAKEMGEGILKWMSWTKNEAVDNSIIPDMVDAILREFDRQTEGAILKTEEMGKGVLAKFRELGYQLSGEAATLFGDALTLFDEETLTDIEFGAKAFADFYKEQEKGATSLRRNGQLLKTMDILFESGKMSIDEYTKAYESFGIQQTTMTSQSLNSVKQISEGFGQMSSSIASSMTDVIMGTKSGFDALGDIVKQTVRMIVNTLVQNFIVSPLIRNIQGMLMGGMGGGGGIGSLLGLGGSMIPGFGLLAGAGMLLGGLFADGGNTAKAGSKPILVGERGPEIFMPGKAGTVVPNDELNSVGGQGDLNVSFTINAIDTRTGVEFLLQNKRVITGVIQEAYQRRGTSGPLG